MLVVVHWMLWWWNRGWRLLKDHLLWLWWWRFADWFLLLLLVRFDFYRWRIGVGRDYRSSAGCSHFSCCWNYWNHHRMMWRRWRKMWWWIDNGLQRATGTSVDKLLMLLLLLLAGW